MPVHRARVAPTALSILRQGAHGDTVRKAQVLLNQRGASIPPLRVDGIFGPKTHNAVLNFQRSAHLKLDGVIGRHTWIALVQTDSAPTPATRTVPIRSLETRPVPASSDGGVSGWPLKRRFEVVLTSVPKYLSPELAAQFRAMLTVENLAIFVSGLAAWAISHAFGVGEIVDLILLAVGMVFIGLGIFKAAEDIGSCLAITLDAKERSDLEKAADYLAQAVVILGITAFFALLARVAARFAPARGAAAEGEAGATPKASAKPGPVDDDVLAPKAEDSSPPPKPAPTDPNSLAAALRDAPKGSPERAALADQFAKVSTHAVEPADRVVLGKWEEGGGYVAEAENNGGVYYKTPDGTYSIMGKEAAWETNEAFLNQQMATGNPIEFTGMSEDEVASKLAKLQMSGQSVDDAPARYREFVFMQQNAPSYGYVQQGMTFVKP
jgi:hypothetical protein